jgi:hypothetical protein
VVFDAYRQEASSQEALNSLKAEESSETAVLAVNTAVRAARNAG